MTTNHAEVIRDVLCLWVEFEATRDAALAALDALTRELAETKRDWAFNISLAEGAVKEQQATITAQAELIASLQEELGTRTKREIAIAEACRLYGDLGTLPERVVEYTAKLEEALEIAKDAMAERRSYVNGGDPSGCWQEMKYGTIWDEEDAQVAAALAPKEQ